MPGFSVRGLVRDGLVPQLGRVDPTVSSLKAT